MLKPTITLKRRRILIDVDTQRDLFTAGGKVCIKNHRRVLGNIRRVFAWSRAKNLKIISTAQVYYPGNGHDYCLTETSGVKKVKYTIREKTVTYQPDGCTDLDRDILKQNQQVILQKRTTDPFDEPRAERMLSELIADEFIVFGGPVETSIKETVLGLIQRGKKVTLLTDAVGYIDKNSADMAMAKIEAKGAKLIESKNLAGSSHLRQVRACGCDRCRGNQGSEMFSTGAA